MVGKGIRVAVIYSPDQAHPKVSWFELNGEKAKVIEQTYFWKSMQGASQLSHYGLQTDKGLFDIVFNSLDQTWRLM